MDIKEIIAEKPFAYTESEDFLVVNCNNCQKNLVFNATVTEPRAIISDLNRHMEDCTLSSLPEVRDNFKNKPE